MIDAPFGGRLGLRLGSANVIPTAGITYYRFLYKAEAAAVWNDFYETVAVNYVREAPATPPVFPPLILGPNVIGGKNLYRFRPHEADLPSLVPVGPGETVSWPSTGFLGNIYSGFRERPYGARIQRVDAVAPAGRRLGEDVEVLRKGGFSAGL